MLGEVADRVLRAEEVEDEKMLPTTCSDLMQQLLMRAAALPEGALGLVRCPSSLVLLDLLMPEPRQHLARDWAARLAVEVEATMTSVCASNLLRLCRILAEGVSSTCNNTTNGKEQT